MNDPASTQELLTHAAQQGANEHARAGLEALPDAEFHTPADVSTASGEQD